MHLLRPMEAFIKAAPRPHLGNKTSIIVIAFRSPAVGETDLLSCAALRFETQNSFSRVIAAGGGESGGGGVQGDYKGVKTGRKEGFLLIVSGGLAVTLDTVSKPLQDVAPLQQRRVWAPLQTHSADFMISHLYQHTCQTLSSQLTCSKTPHVCGLSLFLL